MKIILRGGPLDGEGDHGVPQDTVLYRRSLLCPDARYRRIDAVDANGHHIFEFSPRVFGEPEVREIAYDFPIDAIAAEAADA
jgi:hypothetical protein